LDIPLDEAGLEQARLVGRYLGAPDSVWGPVAAIYSSPMTRAMQTAGPLAGLCGFDAVPDDRLHDVDVGAWQGRPGAEVKAEYPAEYRMWENEPADFAFPQGESLRAVQDRVMGLLGDLLTRYPGQNVTLFSHRVPVKLIIAGVLRAGPEAFWRVRIDNASLTVVEFDGRDFVITLANSNAHLGAAGGGDTPSAPDF
jgi:broad specificity phosphatase PhoE